MDWTVLMWALFSSASMQGCQSQKTRGWSTASDKSVYVQDADT
jgi:hypothetical protein